MTEYHVIYWKHIPTVVIARDGDRQARCALPPRFQAAVDAQAMVDGSTSDRAYSAAWRKSPWQPRDGSADEVARAVALELEAALDTKDKLSVAALDYLWEQFRAQRSQWTQAEATPTDRLRRWLDYQRSLLEHERTALEAYYDYWLQSAKREPVKDKLNQMVAAWRDDVHELVQAAHHVDPSDGAELDSLAAALIGMIQGAALQVILNPAALDLADYFHTVERLLFCGLGGKPDA